MEQPESKSYLDYLPERPSWTFLDYWTTGVTYSMGDTGLTGDTGEVGPPNTNIGNTGDTGVVGPPNTNIGNTGNTGEVGPPNTNTGNTGRNSNCSKGYNGHCHNHHGPIEDKGPWSCSGSCSGKPDANGRTGTYNDSDIKYCSNVGNMPCYRHNYAGPKGFWGKRDSCTGFNDMPDNRRHM
jgi:hypothetical protein